MKTYLDLTKTGIITFVLFGGIAGYAVSFPLGQPIDIAEPLILLIGLYFLSAGSFSLNQAQEVSADAKMPRTITRPLPSGKMAKWQAYFLAILFIPLGLLCLYLLQPITALLGLATIIMYNGLYTLYWKKKWAFGAVPGAIPGALPAVIGYSVAGPQNLLSPDCIYLFLIMFLWQMPHFWVLAIKFKDDYIKGGFPVLPSKVGEQRTLYHIGLYVFAYAGVALTSPLFVHTNILYILLVVPFALKVVWEFFKFFHGKTKWLPFFLWTNFSMLVFLIVPVADKWYFYLSNLN